MALRVREIGSLPIAHAASPISVVRKFARSPRSLSPGTSETIACWNAAWLLDSRARSVGEHSSRGVLVQFEVSDSIKSRHVAEAHMLSPVHGKLLCRQYISRYSTCVRTMRLRVSSDCDRSVIVTVQFSPKRGSIEHDGTLLVFFGGSFDFGVHERVPPRVST